MTVYSNPLNYNRGLMQWYVKELRKLAEKMNKECKEGLRDIYKTGYEQIAIDASVSSQTRIFLNKMREKYGVLFAERAQVLAEKLIKQTRRYSQLQLNSEFKRLLPPSEVNNFLIKGKAISESEREVIKALITTNVNYIKSIPERYLTDITGAVMRSIENGGGIKGLYSELVKYGAKSERQAQLIAQDQTRKAYNSINMRNFEKAGIKRFRWRHNGGSREPRLYHKNVLNGKIFDLDKGAPREDGKGYIYPAQEPYCRCTMEIVFEWE